MPSAVMIIQCQLDQGRRSMRAGTSLSIVLSLDGARSCEGIMRT